MRTPRGSTTRAGAWSRGPACGDVTVQVRMSTREVLDAERSLFQSQLQLSQTQGQLFVALINLYRALGGGWVDEAEKIAPRPQMTGDAATR
jgi:hypothetical protein